MTQEEKDLILKDLCARLPYVVKCKGVTTAGGVNTIKGHCDAVGKYDLFIEEIDGWFSVSNIVPYLRPMSSMTEEEYGQYMDFILWSYNDYDAKSTVCIDKERINEYKEFIYSHHLDDGDLIGKGLALPAPEDMYKTN